MTCYSSRGTEVARFKSCYFCTRIHLGVVFHVIPNDLYRQGFSTQSDLGVVVLDYGDEMW